MLIFWTEIEAIAQTKLNGPHAQQTFTNLHCFILIW